MGNETQGNRREDGTHLRTMAAMDAWSHSGRSAERRTNGRQVSSSCHQPQADDDQSNSHRSLSTRATRQLVLARLDVLKLRAPFSWEAYVSAVQRELAERHPGHQVLIERADLGAQEFGRWIVAHLPAIHRSLTQDRAPGDALMETLAPNDVECDDLVVEWLQLPWHLDDEHLEHAVFHELGHRELGHITFEAVPGSQPRIFACEKGSSDKRERDAEMFATVVTRLAHGWDPGVVHAPCLDRFFDLLS